METIERVTVGRDRQTVSSIVWRRFRRQMPGLVERIYELNPGLADSGPFLLYGTTFSMPIPEIKEIEIVKPIRLWGNP